jgi:hypothetical protein
MEASGLTEDLYARVHPAGIDRRASTKYSRSNGSAARRYDGSLPIDPHPLLLHAFFALYVVTESGGRTFPFRLPHRLPGCAGNEHRSIATTKMNEASSRSHSLLVVNIVKTVQPSAENPRGERKRSSLTLVDLAGSVRSGSHRPATFHLLITILHVVSLRAHCVGT